MFVCLSVCLFVCLISPPRNFNETRQIIYRWKHTRPERVLNYIWTFSDHPSGRYWPETGRDWRKNVQNGLFFEVLVEIKCVNGQISTRYFNARCKVIGDIICESFVKLLILSQSFLGKISLK